MLGPTNKHLIKLTDEIFYFPESGMLDSNVYLIKNQEHFLLIDGGNGLSFKGIVRELTNKGFSMNNMDGICQTHLHVDHILGLYKFKEEFPNIKIYMSEIEAIPVEKGDKNIIIPPLGFGIDQMVGSFMNQIGLKIVPLTIDKKFKDGDTFRYGKYNFKILITPGHTTGGICLYESEKRILFSGDTAFPGGSFGRVDFPGGNANQLIKSLHRLAQLGNIEMLFAGHMDAVTKGAQRSLEASARIAASML
ncbi:MAG: MBL fold metallo-hydrolase [Candidatus Lokiarchaeota archaeon]|nr:MBL fold metallo-hydrolase [Candidatus Lokiarchaeota archaeon]